MLEIVTELLPNYFTIFNRRFYYKFKMSRGMTFALIGGIIILALILLFVYTSNNGAQPSLVSPTPSAIVTTSPTPTSSPQGSPSPSMTALPTILPTSTPKATNTSSPLPTATP